MKRWGAIPGSNIAGQVGGAESAPVTIRDNRDALLLDATTDAASSGGFGPVARRFMQSGVYNGDFYAAPADANGVIDANNPLPYWTWAVVSGTSVYATSVADTAQASGRKITFTMVPGAAGDEAYLEQIIPVNGSRGRTYGYFPGVTAQTGADVNGMLAYLNGQYLLADGVTTTGTSDEQAITTTSIGASTLRDFVLRDNRAVNSRGAVPSDAYFLRIRFGFRRSTEATTASGSVSFTEARVGVGVDYIYLTPDLVPDTNGPFILRASGAYGVLESNHGGSGVTQITLEGGAASNGIQLASQWVKLPLSAQATVSLNSEATARWETDRQFLGVHDSVREKGATPIGWNHALTHPAWNSTLDPSGSRTLAAVSAGNGGAVAALVYTGTSMLLRQYAIWNLNTASLRTAEVRLYEDRLNNTGTIDFVSGSDATFSFTPGAAGQQVSGTVSTLPLMIPPGWYWLVVRNTSATQTFDIGITVASSRVLSAQRIHQIKDIAALGATLDMTTGWTQSSNNIALMGQGSILGQSAVF